MAEAMFFEEKYEQVAGKCLIYLSCCLEEAVNESVLSDRFGNGFLDVFVAKYEGLLESGLSEEASLAKAYEMAKVISKDYANRARYNQLIEQARLA